MVTCIAVPGFEIGEIGGLGERFIDNKKIEGTIPEMIDEMHHHGLKAPVFDDIRGGFLVTLSRDSEQDSPQVNQQDEMKMKILEFCAVHRTRKEIAEFVGIKDVRYLKEAYLSKLLEQDLIRMTIPDKPTSRNQKYVAVKKN